MQYAIIDHNGKQYVVKSGDTLTVDLMADKKAGDQVVFDSVLFLSDGEKKSLGTPLVKGAKVEATILSHIKGEKVRVAKYKAKVRYRNVRGFRADLTQLTVNAISIDK
jgi:large subunit ribosomal protein L21